MRRAALARSPRTTVSRPCDARGLAGWAHVPRQGPNVPAAPQTRQFDTHRRPALGAAPGHRAGRLVCLKTASLARHPYGALTPLASSPVDHDVDPGGLAECPTECGHHLWPVNPDDEHPAGSLWSHIHHPRTARTPKLMACAFRSAAEHRQARPYQAPDRGARRVSSNRERSPKRRRILAPAGRRE